MSAPAPGTQDWLDLVVEDVVEPDLPIVDPHHHLWPAGGALPYGLAELHADTGDGHRVEQTVFVECHAAYRDGGDPELAPVGETEFVAGEAMRDPAHLISGIVAHADLRSPPSRRGARRARGRRAGAVPRHPPRPVAAHAIPRC